MDLIVVTHGATDNPADLCIGQSDLALSSTGFTDIQKLATSWAGASPRFLFSSDLRRAKQSAQVFASHLAIEPLFDPRLRELDLGDWQGQNWEQVTRDDRQRYRQWLENPIIQAAPGGESFTDLLRRSGAWLASLLTSTDEHDTVLAVMHASTLRALLCHSLGLAPARSRNIAADSARASQIRYRDGQFEVSYLNASRFQDD